MAREGGGAGGGGGTDDELKRLLHRAMRPSTPSQSKYARLSKAGHRVDPLGNAELFLKELYALREKRGKHTPEDETLLQQLVALWTKSTTVSPQFSFLGDVLCTLSQSPDGYEPQIMAKTVLSTPNLTQPRVWMDGCRVLCDLLPRCGGRGVCRDAFRKVLSFLEGVHPHEFGYKKVQAGVQVLRVVADPARSLLPLYELMVEVRKYITKSTERQPPWFLEDILGCLAHRRTHFTRLLTSLGSHPSYTRPRLCDNDHEHDLFLEGPPLPGSPAYDHGVRYLLMMMMQCMPLSFFGAHVGKQDEARHENGSSVIRRTRFSCEMVEDAIMMYISQLVKEETFAPTSMHEAVSGPWNKWLVLADELYGLGAGSLIDGVRLIQKLSRILPRSSACKMKFVAWLIFQVLPTQCLRAAIVHDLQHPEAEIVRTIMSLKATTTIPVYPVIDQAILGMAIRMAQILKAESQQSVTSDRMLDGVGVLEPIRQEWAKARTGKIIDIHNLPDSAENGLDKTKLALLSSYDSKSIIEDIRTYLMRESSPGQGPLGKDQPLSFPFLAMLFIQTRLRLVTEIGEILQSGSYDPHYGLMETYARLICTAPMSFLDRKFLAPFQNSKDFVIQTMVELATFRLFRVCNFMLATSRFIQDLHKGYTTRNSSLFRNLDACLMKALLYCPEIQPPPPVVGEMILSETMNRVLVIGLARLFRTRGIRKASDLAQLDAIVQRTLQLTGYQWSNSTLCYFPERMRVLIAHAQEVLPPVFQEERRKLIALQSRQGQGARWEQVLQRHQDDVSFVVCEGWRYLVCVSPSPHHAQHIRSLPPRAISKGTFLLVEMLLHEFVGNIINRDKLKELAGQLDEAIWTHYIVQWETVLLALSDHLEHLAAQSLLRDLLLVRPNFLHRVNAFVEDGEDVLFNKRREAGSLLNLFYGNVCLRTLPVLDVLIGRLIEHDKIDFLEELIASYGIFMARAHDYPITFVRDMLLYYYEHSNIDRIRGILWNIVVAAGMSVSNPLSAYMNGDADASVFDAAYFDELIRTVGTLVYSCDETVLDPPTPSLSNLDDEFPNTTRYGDVRASLEILLLPISKEEIVKEVLRIVDSDVSVPSSSLHGAATILAWLPSSFSPILAAETVSHMSRIEEPSAMLRRSLWEHQHVDNIATGLETRTSRFLYLFHAFCDKVSLDRLPDFVDILRQLRPSTSFHLLCVLRLIAPIMGVVAEMGNIEELIEEACTCLAELPTAEMESYVLDPVVDLLHHCKYVLRVNSTCWAPLTRVSGRLRLSVRSLLPRT